MTETKHCIYCGKEFSKSCEESYKGWDKRKYCSRKCNDIKKRGMLRKPSITRICQQCGNEFVKPYEYEWKRWAKRKFCSKPCADIGKIRKAPSTAFKKGTIPHNFKNNGYGYQAVHAWLLRHYPKKGICEECLKESKTQYANITGKYLRDRSDYRELCYSCHSKIDRANPKHPSYTQTCEPVI